MKAAQVFGDRIIINEVQDAALQGRKGAVAVVLGCGLCGSDIVKFDHKTVPQGTVLGHEIVAKILEINSDTNFKAGDVIVTTHHIPCGKCIYCIQLNELINQCTFTICTVAAKSYRIWFCRFPVSF